MATLLQEEIESIRSAQTVLEGIPDLSKESRAFYEERIRQSWEKIRIYRSNQICTVFVVDGLFDYEVHYLDLKYMQEDLLDIAEVMIDDCLEITIRLKQMTGREFGRLEVIED